MKKHLHNSLRALFLSLAVLLSLPMLAEEVEIDGINYYLNAEAKQVAVVRKSSGAYSGELVIPETVEYQGTTYSVTGIGSSAFWGCSVLTSVTIPNSMTNIGSDAFWGCEGLTSVHISDIAAWCNIDFANYMSNPLRDAHHLYLNGEEVKDLIIPNSVTSIGEYAFYGCSGLTSVTIGNSVTSIGGSAFQHCSGLTSVTIPNSVTRIEGCTFAGCRGLTSVTIPNSVTSIGNAAFYSCSGLTSVTIPNSVTSIESSAFSSCGLTTVTIPNSVTSIGDGAFSHCKGLTSVTIGNSVTSIGSGAFYWCSDLTSVTIPNSVTSIGENAFWHCDGLTSVTIGNSVTSIENEAFYGCTGLTSVHISDIAAWCKIDFSDNTSNPLHYAEHLYLNGEEVKDLVIPNSVTSIGERAFLGYKGLTSVTIGNSVESIGISAFEYCSGLTSVTIGNSVTSIGSGAFSDCSVLTSVTIGNSVTSIGSYAFYRCEGLTSVTIPNSVTSIGYAAFKWCSVLTSVTIGNSVESIGDEAFRDCSKLLDVYCYAENVPSTASNTFESSPIEKATLHVPAASVESYKATEPWSRFEKIVAISTEIDGIRYVLNAETKQAIVIAKSSGEYSGEVVIPESVDYGGTIYSVTSIGETAFYGCSGLTSVTIGNSVTSIGDKAFYYCLGLTSVTIPNSVTSIGYRAFEGCSGLTAVHISDIVAWCNIDFLDNNSNPLHYAEHLYLNGDEVKDLVIPNSVTSIGERAFLGYKGLTSVTIPNSVTSIGLSAFYGCSGLTSVTIPNSVMSIGGYAFYGCSGLASVTIPNSVTSIGSYAFYKCSGMTSVTIPNSVESIGQGAFEWCSGLTSVTISNSVTSIGKWAFANCPELLDVYCYAENVPSTASNTFESSPIENATLHVPVVSVESYKATEPWSRFGRNTLLPHLTLTDGEVFDNNIEQEVGTLTYTRTLPNMLWNPLYVPFKIPYEDLEENYQVAYINAMHSYDNDDNGEIDEMIMEIVKIKAGTLKPNHPYLIKAKNEEAKVMNIVQEAVTLYPAEITTLDCSSVYTKFEITGTYQKMTSGDLNGSLVISTDGAWKKLSPTSTLKPFRFYLTISSREGSPVEIEDEAMSRVRIRVMGEEDNATGIDEVNTEDVKRETEIYDLSGRRVSAPAKGGVYIINGKKVIY